MGNLVENFEKNSRTTEIREREWELSKNRESKFKDMKHLEMAYEWQNGNGKREISFRSH